MFYLIKSRSSTTRSDWVNLIIGNKPISPISWPHLRLKLCRLPSLLFPLPRLPPRFPLNAWRACRCQYPSPPAEPGGECGWDTSAWLAACLPTTITTLITRGLQGHRRRIGSAHEPTHTEARLIDTPCLALLVKVSDVCVPSCPCWVAHHGTVLLIKRSVCVCVSFGGGAAGRRYWGQRTSAERLQAHTHTQA